MNNKAKKIIDLISGTNCIGTSPDGKQEKLTCLLARLKGENVVVLIGPEILPGETKPENAAFDVFIAELNEHETGAVLYEYIGKDKATLMEELIAEFVSETIAMG